MNSLRFEWDPIKNAANLKKHGIGFEEAKTCFEDDFAIVFDDLDHSKDEERSIILGMSTSLKTLIVVFTERTQAKGQTIVNRIISCRKATKKEMMFYWSQRPTLGEN